MRGKLSDCKRCLAAVWDGDGFFTGCRFGEEPVAGCLAILVKRPQKVCFDCGDETVDWDYAGPREDRVVQCRKCLCGDWIPEYLPRSDSMISRFEEKLEGGHGVNCQKVKRQVTKKQREHGITHVGFDGGIHK